MSLFGLSSCPCRRPRAGIRGKPSRGLLQVLEPRLALTATINLDGGYSIGSYAGVGFRENEVASFSATLNGQPDPTTSDFKAQVNWGDGESSGDLVNLGHGQYEVKGSHIYKTLETDQPIKVTITGPDGSNASEQTASANVQAMPSGIAGTAPPTIGTSAAPEAVVLNVDGGYSVVTFAGVGFQENDVASFSATVNGVPDTTLSDFHAQINFGDTASWTTGDLVNLGNGQYLVKGTHVYKTADVNIPIVVYVTGPDGTSASEETASANVMKMPSGIPGTKPPTTTNSSAPENVVLNLDGGYSVSSVAGLGFNQKQLASFTVSVDGQPDNKPGDFHAQINYGDSSSWSAGTIVNVGTGEFAVKGSHIYKQPNTNIPIVVYITGPDGTSISGQTASANVTPNPNTITAVPIPASGTEGKTFSGAVATFTDTDTKATADDFTAMITWSDRSTSEGKIAALGKGYEVTAEHLFAEEGTNAFVISINGKDGASDVVPDVAKIKDAALTAKSASITAKEGATFSGTVATFTDANSKGAASDFSAKIAWGDGTTTAGQIAAASGGGFKVTGSHAYAEEGTYSVTVSIADDGGSKATVASTAHVADAPLTAQAVTTTVTAGASFSEKVAAFHDADPGGTASDFTATIAWGDGKTSTGKIVAESGGFEVTGSHAYATFGTETATVTIVDAGGSKATAKSTIDVVPAPLKLTAQAISDNYFRYLGLSSDDGAMA